MGYKRRRVGPLSLTRRLISSTRTTHNVFQKDRQEHSGLAVRRLRHHQGQLRQFHEG